MPRKKIYPVTLTDEERLMLEQFVKTGEKKACEITRARILLLSDQGKSDQEIMDLLSVSRPPIFSMRKKYTKREKTPLLEIVSDAPRSGRPPKLDSVVEAQMTLLACSDPPEGSVRWTLRMLADRLVELNVIDHISHESVRSLLKKTS